MRAARNEPCPCGSGRKYKVCCMQGDRARERAASLLGAEGEPAWHAPAREAQVWEAEVAPFAGRLEDDPDAALALVIVTANGFVVGGDTLHRRPVGARERARVLAGAVLQGGRALGVLPGRVRVRDEAVAAALGGELAGREIRVEAAPLEELDQALDAALHHLAGEGAGRVASPVTWAETEASEEEIASYHAAAAEYYRAEPWNQIDDDTLIGIELTEGGAWTASVMGGAGVEFGLALYSDPDDLLALMEGEVSITEHLLRMTGYALTTSFDPRSERPRPMQREVASHGWPVAGPSAYPILLGLNLPERRITAEHLRVSAAVLRAVARLARGEEPDPAEVGSIRPLTPAGPWPVSERPEPVCAEGPGADPEAALRAIGSDGIDTFETLEGARLERMTRWLEARAPSRAQRTADLRNADIWTDFLVYEGVPAGAVTEYDLRLFLYRYYVHRARAPKTAARALPRSMRRIIAFLEEEEGIRYPFAERVLRELDDIAASASETGCGLDVALAGVSAFLDHDLDAREMVHDFDLPGTEAGWPELMSYDVALLEHELQRRWLLWYDEAVRGGVDDHAELGAVLLVRQRAWEQDPHPGFGGRTPAEVVAASPP